jgi:hypothetical protein
MAEALREGAESVKLYLYSLSCTLDIAESSLRNKICHSVFPRSRNALCVDLAHMVLLRDGYVINAVILNILFT